MKNVVIVFMLLILFVGGALIVNGGSSEDGATGKTVECVVMGTKIDPEKAYAKTEYKGKTYYFCCAGCPGEFAENPEKYVK